MIDLHMHTNYSDGYDSVKELLKKAESIDLQCISITDHNNCGGYSELKDVATRQMFSGKIIPGVELNTKVLNVPIEILGYNIDTNITAQLISDTYLNNNERDKLEVQRLYEKCTNENIELPDDFVDKYDGSTYASKYLHSYITENSKNRSLISEQSWNNSNIFYREYMSNPESKFFVDMDDILPDFETASRIIREAHGLVFIPHIFEYRDNSEKILNFILKNYKIDGIECYYRNFTKEQTEYLLDICKKHNLYVSGGSDYHGKNHPGVEMGIGEGSLHVPEYITGPWAKYL